MIPTIHAPPARSIFGTSIFSFGLIALLLLSVTSVAEIPAQPDSVLAPATTPPAKPEILELSVSNDTRVSALVVWHYTGGKLTATQISKKFSFEWLRIPEGATSFLVTSKLDEKSFNPATFVGLADFKHKSIYVSLRPEGAGASFIPINTESLKKDQTLARYEPRFTPEPGTEGWVYLGSWNNDISKWNTVYWLETSSAEQMSNRRRVSIPPEQLVGKSAILDFPLACRKGPATKFEQVKPGEFLGPGSTFQFQEISRIPYPSHHEIWAKISNPPKP
jgi:hypothetical protein